MGLRPHFTTSHAITAALTQIERARGFLEAAKLSEEWLRRMGERALVLEAHHTTHIEGTHLKRLVTLSEFYDRDRPAFYRAIQSVRDRDMDLTGWLEFFTHGLATQLTEVQQRGERIIRLDVLARRHKLSERQSAALGHVLEHGKLTLQDYVSLQPETNRRTLQRDLRALVEKQLLEERGTGPTDPTKEYLLSEALRKAQERL